jgi:rhamnogalacturonyl hydrolase YesR
MIRTLSGLIFALLISPPASGRDAGDSAAALRSVADAIVRATSYLVVDTTTGITFRRADPAAVRATTRMQSDYNDWTYFNGALLCGMLSAGELLHEPRYEHYAAENFRFMFDNLPYFQEQWEVLQVRRASLYRVFRMNMLDDCGAMGAALIDVYRRERDPRYLRMIQRIANYITNVQLRLNDGTLVRPDPRYMTLWADDLYMSVPFLVRMGRLTGESRYYDDAVHQVTRFYSLLMDQETGVCHHAWFSDSGTRSPGRWGRANGWMMMATVELLDRLPETHRGRDTVLTLFRQHVRGIAALQDTTGLWHQLVDQPDSYLETSSSAMFCYAMAKGIQRGWLSAEYRRHALRAWGGASTRIRPDGLVEGICRGTEVGFDLEFYRLRPTPLNDPRGLGAVLLAGSHIQLLASPERSREK